MDKNSNFFCEDTFILESKALHNFRMIHDNFMKILICAMHIGGKCHRIGIDSSH